MVTSNWHANNLFRKLDRTNQAQECLRSQDTQKNHTEQSLRLLKMTEVYIVNVTIFFLTCVEFQKPTERKKKGKMNRRERE